MQKEIIKFIQKHHLLSLSTSNNNQPYICSCFYAFNKLNFEFVILSELKTKHAQQALANSHVACSIALETSIIGKIQGIQMLGKISHINEKEHNIYRNIYLRRFPFAIFANADMWKIEPEYIKFTDNRLGFGTKLIWEANKNNED